MQFDIKMFDNYKEGNRIEAKNAKGGLPHSIWETYSAFANTYGGVIILGAEELKDGSFITSGIKNADKLIKDFWNIINNISKVSINLLTENDVNVYDYNNDVIIVINIPMAKRELKPVYIDNNIFNGTYKRNNEGDFHCTPLQVKSMLRDQSEESDTKVLDKLGIDSLNFESIHGYRNRYKYSKEGRAWEDLSDNDFLEMIGAIKLGEDNKLHPTSAGLLMFGNEYKIMYEFVEYFLDYREVLDSSIRWTDRLHSQSGDWSGNLYDFYFRVYNKLIKNVKVPFKMEGGFRVDDTPVHKVLREVLANTLINADYYVPRGIVIIQNNDSIRFENPGSIRVGKYQMLKGGESDPRNKTLMKMFNLIDIGERAGFGIPQLLKVWNDEGFEEPVIDERLDDVERTFITLSFKKKADKKPIKADKKPIKADKERVESILEYINQNETITNKEARELLNLADSTTKRLLAQMVLDGLIEAIGENKNRKYILKK